MYVDTRAQVIKIIDRLYHAVRLLLLTKTTGQPNMTDVLPSTDEINAARNGVYMQLRETTNLVAVYGSLTQAIETLGLSDFVENQVQVIASSRAWVRHTENRLRNIKSKTT